MRKISKIEPTMPTVAAKKKVAAYARISMESERMHHSLSAQISYYNALIQKKPEWEFAGVYALTRAYPATLRFFLLSIGLAVNLLIVAGIVVTFLFAMFFHAPS